MAVAVDAVSTASTTSSAGVTTATHTLLTVGSSLSNGALIFGVYWDNAATSPNAHWDSTGTNQAMTLLGTGTGGGTAVMFGLRNPTSGAKTFSCSWTTAAEAIIFGISFTGVDQTSDVVAFKNFNTATATSAAPSVVITSAINDMTIGNMCCSSSATVNSLNNTQLYLQNTAFRHGGMNRGVGASTVTMGATLSGSFGWTMTGIDVAAAAAALTLNPKNLVMM